MSASNSASPTGSVLRASLAQLDPLREPGLLDPGAAGREHLRALVDPDHGAPRLGARELDRDRRGTGRDVEHAPRVRRHA